MNRQILVASAIAMLTLLAAFRYAENKMPSPPFDVEAFKQINIVRCSPDWESLGAWLEETDIPPMPGAGNYTWNISTSHDSAQFYFNQGINMYYGFHLIESMASFKKAARFDPSNAMIWWAQALAYGPNINDFGYRASPEALEAQRQAELFAGAASETEKALIAAMAVRYSVDSSMSREQLNQDYADRMKEAYEKYPANADIAALYADALMLQHPWDLWFNNGTPKPWTPRIREILEGLILLSPRHPGANHYYIHVMEPSPFAELALPSADRLGELTPGLSHMVHMPSHIYLRTGSYKKGSEVNEAAVNAYRKYLTLMPVVATNDFLYQLHNQHMQTNCAMLAGRSKYAFEIARELAAAIPPDYLSMGGPIGNAIQYIHATPTLVNIRFEKFDELLSAQQPAVNHIYSQILWHFGKGMAYSGKHRQTEAKDELRKIRELMKDSSLYIPLTPFSAAIEGARCAENLLAGMISFRDKKTAEALLHLQRAVNTEKNMVYTEPRDWLLNPAHYLGMVQLQARKYADAEKTYRDDLRNNDKNALSLVGLRKALEGQKKTTEAARVKLIYEKAVAAGELEE